MVKLLLMMMLGGALANSIASARTEPPLLIDASQSTLDAAK